MNTLIASDSRQALHENWSNYSDEVLVTIAQGGDRLAFAALCERHSASTLRRIHRITKDWADAEDALQDALMNAFTHLNAFQGKARFSSWFTRIAINSSLMILRKRQVWREISLDDDGDGSGYLQLPDPKSENPEDLFLQNETAELVRLAIHNLRPKFRQVFELRQVHGHSTKIVCQELGISVAAAKSRLSRARSCLRKVPGLQEKSK